MEFVPFFPDESESRFPVWGARLDTESGVAELGTAHCNRERHTISRQVVTGAKSGSFTTGSRFS